MKSQINQKRRKFFQQMGVLAGGTSLFMQQNNLGFINNALAMSDSYAGISDQKSLVCIVLEGGNDAFNMFIPYENSSYQQYASIRGALAIPRGDLHPVTGEQHAFHPSMPQVRDLYNQNNIALVSNVGNLVQPLTRAQYLAYQNGENSSIQVPPDLFSHSHQREIAQTNLPPEVGVSHPGWGGLMADLLIQANSNQSIAPTFSLAGSNLWQAGVQTRPFSIGGTVNNFNFLYSPPAARLASLENSTREILNLNYSNLFQQYIAGLTSRTEQSVGGIQDALALSVGDIQTPYNGTNGLASQLRKIARLIYARDAVGGLGMNRQIFFARLGGFDTHKDQIDTHATLLSTLSEALDSFYQTTVELGVADSVTTFTLSEFGRPMGINGFGSDHGWGGHQLVMGGAVDGGRIHGAFPDLTPEGGEDSGNNGRIIPSISNEQYGATLAKWMGINDNDLHAIFPNLSNFSIQDLGFMGA